MKRNFLVTKKSLTATLILFSVLATGVQSVNAAEETSKSYSIQLKADIPQTEFTMVPVETGWITTENQMEFDPVQKKLASLKKQFQFYSSGAIQAKFDTASVPGAGAQLSNGVDTIPLTVKFGDKTISDTPVIVKNATEAKAGGREWFEISAGDVTGKKGLYKATVAIIFEQAVESGS